MDPGARNLLFLGIFFCALLAVGTRLLEKSVQPKSGVETAAPKSAPAAGVQAGPVAAVDPETRRHNQLGIEHLAAGRYDEAIAEFMRARHNDFADQALRANLAAAHFHKGQSAIKEGSGRERYERALSSFRSAAETDPSRAVFSYTAGYCAYQSGDPLQAATELERTVRDFPDEAKAYALLGQIYYEQGRIAEAVTTLEKGLTLDSASAQMSALLAKAKGESGFSNDSSIHFDFHYSGPRQADFLRAKPRISRLLDRAHVEVGRELLFELKDRVQVLFYDPVDFAAALKPDAWAGALFDGKIRIPLTDYDAEQERIRAVVFHEYTHAAVFRLSPACPPWLNEGLAQLVEGKDSAEAERRLRAAGGILPAARLKQRFAGMDTRQAITAYDMSLSLARRLKQRRGFYNIVEYLKELGAGGDEAALFRKHFHRTYEEFFADWKRETGL
ncbi:MAG: tetratricopeptide repeat protein [Elusimicrobiota bacterium]